MSGNPNPTLLDGNRILQQSFDESTDRLRVEAEVTATIGTVEVVINASSGDNIAISDGTNTVDVTPAGELKVIDVSSSAINAKLSDDYGTSAQALRTAAQIGNTTGQADFNSGTTGSQTLRVSSNISDGSGNKLTSGTYDTNRLLHIQSPDNIATPINLNGPSVVISIALAGLNSVGFQLSSGNFFGTLMAEASIDGGINWTVVPFYDPANSAILTSLVYTGTNPTKIVSIVPIGGSSHIRVRVSSYTSGTAVGLLRAANVSGATGAITSAAFGNVINNVVSITNNIPILVLSANPNRKYAYFGNNSGSTVRLQFFSSTNLSGTTGIPVPSQVGFYELRGDNLFTGDVYAFCSSDVDLSVTEGTP